MILARGKTSLVPSIAVFVAASIWGLYWLPLRKIEQAGVNANWSVVAIYAVPFAFILPWAWVRRHSIRQNLWPIAVIGFPIGGGLACYATGFLHTTVLRTTLLFYMTPIWSTVLAMIFLQEKPDMRRWLAIAIGLLGLCLMLMGNGGNTSPIAINPGDLSALIAGLLWSVGTVLIRRAPDIDSLDVIPCQYLFAIAFSAAFFWVGQSENSAIPTADAWLRSLPWLIGFYVVVFLPTLYICIRGAQVLSPGRIGILMMSEVLVAGISAPLLAGELITRVEWLATALIVAAAVLEITTPEPSD